MLAERFVCGLRGPIICGEVAALPLQIAVKLRTRIALALCEKPCPVALRTVDPFETLLPAGFDVKLPENHVEGAPAGTRLGRPPLHRSRSFLGNQMRYPSNCVALLYQPSCACRVRKTPFGVKVQTPAAARPELLHKLDAFYCCAPQLRVSCVLPPWRSVWSGSIGSGAIWMAISPKRRRIARRRGARARNRSARARRAWSARLPGRAAQIAATSCCRVSTPTVSARAAISNCTAASSASTLTPPCASSAPSRSPSASPKKTPGTTAPFTNSAPRSRRTRPPRLRWPRLLCLRPVRRVLTTPARPSTIFSRSSGGPSRRSFSFAHRNLQSEGVSRSFGPYSPQPFQGLRRLRAGCRSRHPRRVGEQRGFLLRIAGDALELRIVVAQRFGHLHLRTGEEADQLQ